MKKVTGSLLAMALLCCVSGKTALCAEKEQKDVTEITFMVTGTGDYAQRRKEELEETLLDDFPDIEIHVEAYPDEEYYNILNTRLSMGEGPDFFFIQPYLAGPNAVQKLAPAGYLEPLDELSVIRNASEEQKKPVSYDGHVYGLSFGNMVLCTYYNTEIFEEQGLSIPENWTEFLEICKKLKEAGITPIISGNKDSYALQFGIYQIAASQVYAANPDFNAQLENGITHFTDSDTWDTVLDKYLLLYKNNYVQEQSLAMSSSEAIKRFSDGEAAMLFGGDFQYSTLISRMEEDEFGVFPLPSNEEGEPLYAVVSKGGGTAVYSGSRHVELCKRIYEKLYEEQVEIKNEIWSPFQQLQEKGQFTINCNQGWKGDVEWVLEDGVSRKIGGDSISVGYITRQMQNAYEKG